MKELIYSKKGEVQDFYDLETELDSNRDLVLLAIVNTWNSTHCAVVNISKRENFKTLKEAVVRRLLVNSDSNLTIYSDDKGIVVEEAHHDATNIYYYRYLRKCCKYEQLEKSIRELSNMAAILRSFDNRTCNMWKVGA